MDTLKRHAVLASLHARQTHADVRTAHRDQQYLYLAAFFSIHSAADLAGEGIAPDQLSQQVTECFGYEDAHLTRFKKNLRRSGLFTSNGTPGTHCRYSVVETDELKAYLELYRAHEAKATQPRPLDSTLEGQNLGSEFQGRVPNEEWDDVERRAADQTVEERLGGLPLGYVLDTAAGGIAARLFTGELAQHPELAEMVASHLLNLAANKRAQ